MPFNAETDASAHISQMIVESNKDSRDATIEVAAKMSALLEELPLHIGAVAIGMLTASFCKMMTDHAVDLAEERGDPPSLVPSSDAHALAIFFITRRAIASAQVRHEAMAEKAEALQNGAQLS